MLRMRSTAITEGSAATLQGQGPGYHVELKHLVGKEEVRTEATFLAEV